MTMPVGENLVVSQFRICVRLSEVEACHTKHVSPFDSAPLRSAALNATMLLRSKHYPMGENLAFTHQLLYLVHGNL